MRVSVLLVVGIVLLGACSGSVEQKAASPTPTVSPTNAAEAEGWIRDAEKEAVDPDDAQGWVAAWFAGENAMPDSVSRRWRQVNGAGEKTPEELLEQSVVLLSDPPSERTSAFAEGVSVHGVTFNEGQVLIDLDAESPSLYGHGSTGYLIAVEQLTSAAAFYFPEAETLCIAYDGEPTTIEEGGPIFLHDASGCPLPLR